MGNKTKSRLSKLAGELRTALGTGLAGVIATTIGFGAKDALAFEEGLTNLEIASQGAMGNMAQVRQKILEVSEASGVAKEQLLGGAHAFVALTGDGKAASLAMETFARVSKAANTSVEDVARAAAGMQSTLGISAPEFEKAFSILIKGGKLGAVELSDFAGLLSELAPLMAQFSGGKGIEGLSTIGGAMQITMRGAGGSADKARTQLLRLMESFSAPRTIKALKEFKINPFDKRGKQRNFIDIIEEMQRKGVFRDVRNLSTIFESSEARAAARQLGEVNGELRQLSTETRNATDVSTDYARAQQSSAAKAKKAWNNLKNAVTEAFTPERIEVFTRALMAVVQAASYVLDKFMAIGEFLGDSAGWVYQTATGEETGDEASEKRAASWKRGEGARRERYIALREGRYQAPQGAGGNTTTIAPTINIHGVTDPKAVGDVVDRKLRQYDDRKRRDMTAGTAQ